MLLRPLFFTSFLIDDQLADEGLTGRGPIVISSASSKTAIAAAFLLARREGVELIGLTSPRNTDFVEGLGIYGRTVAYEEIDSLERGTATYVDIAGDGEVRRAVHSHFGDELAHSMAVGITHWEELGAGEGELPGPAPAFFFAPDRVVKRSEDWGRAGLEQRVAEAWHPFCEWTAAGWRRSPARASRLFRAPTWRCSRAASTRRPRTSSRWPASRTRSRCGSRPGPPSARIPG